MGDNYGYGGGSDYGSGGGGGGGGYANRQDILTLRSFAPRET